MLWMLLACGGDLRGPLVSTPLFSEVLAPDRLASGFWLRDADGLGVDDWQAGELSVRAGGQDPGATLSRAQDWDLLTPVILLLDVSDEGELAAVVQVAQVLLDARAPHQPMQVLAFSDGVQTLTPQTTSQSSLQAALDELSLQGPTTNLRGAVLDALGAWEDQLDPHLGMSRGVLVVVSDGGTGPDPSTLDEVLLARADKAVVGVELGQAEGLSELASAGVASDGQGALELVDRASGALILASWCSDERDGLLGIELDFRRGRLRSSVSDSVDAAGMRDWVSFDSASPIPEPIRDLNGVILGQWLVVGGGDGDGSTYSAPILDNGRIGNWRTGANIPSGENTRLHGVGESVYAINGQDAWFAPMQEGVVGEWSEMESPGYSNMMRSDGGTLYSIARERVYWVDASAGGALSGWSASAEIPEGGLDNYVGGGIAGDYLYVVGSWRSGVGEPWHSRGWFTLAADPSAWTAMALPEGYLGTWLSVADDGEHLLIFPGSDADSRSVWMGMPGPSGQIGWEEAGLMAVERDAFSLAVSEQGQIFMHGGQVEGTPVSTGVMSQLGEGLQLGCE